MPTSPATSSVAVAELGRAHAEKALVAEAAGGDLGEILLRQAVDQTDVEAAGRGEIAFVGEVRSLANVDRADRFRHQPVQVGVALAVRVGAHVDRHVVDGDRQVGAVVEIVAAQEILVGFALAAVLRHDQARHGFEHFARARDRPRVEFRRR